MTKHKCSTCGGDLILTIGSDRAVCDHCGQAVAVDPQDVKTYQDLYQSAETLMRTDTLSGYEDALTRLQSIAFIPQAKEKAALCEKRMRELQRAQGERKLKKAQNTGSGTALGVVVAVVVVLFILAAIAGVVYAGYRLIRGELSQTEIIVFASVAAVLVLLLIIGKIKS